MLKRIVLQNTKTKEKIEFKKEIDYKDFIIYKDKSNEWEIVDLKFEKKTKQKAKQVGNRRRFSL